MPLINMHDMLWHAYRNGYAVSAFELINLEIAEGIIRGAERCSAPVILTLAESQFGYFSFEPILSAVEAASRRSSVPVAIHLDCSVSLKTAVRGINAGCNGIKVDTSCKALDNCISLTRALADMAHTCGVPVEGSLGFGNGPQGGDADHHPGLKTDTMMSKATRYVDQTGVDCLCVSLDSGEAQPQEHIQTLKQINEVLGIPLAIQGDMEFSANEFQELSASGIVKINHSTTLIDVAGACVRIMTEASDSSDYLKLMQDVQDAITLKAQQRMQLCGSAGRASEVIEHCQPWLPVEHLIIYNVTGVDEHHVETMMAEGRRVLDAIPGVREIMTGKAVKEDAEYRYTWLVRFCHPAVIDSYRNHPDHVAFADKLFRPVSGDRISIDYQIVETLASSSGDQP